MERIPAHTAEVGEGMTVRRALPTRQRRMVGAWCFLDHAGPADYAADGGLRVGPHPHIGLQTFTWMIDGEVLHRDSLGYVQVIRPGQVNLMTAGRGITHAELPAGNGPGRLHAAQLWIALPDSERHREPSFQHYPTLPTLASGGFTVTVLAGSAFGLTSPAMVFTPLVGLDFNARGAARMTMPLDAGFEHGLLVLEGAIRAEGEVLEPGTLLYFAPGKTELAIECDAGCKVLLVGGEPFPEEILLWWNFVARTPEEMAKATEDWNAGRWFSAVPESPLPRLVAPDIRGLHLKTPTR